MNIDLVKQQLAALSASKFDDFRSNLADDAVYDEHASMRRVSGADAYVKVNQAWKRAFPDLTARVLNAFESGDQVFVEVEWVGTQSGPFKSPFGDIPPSNKRGSVKAALCYRIANGKIAEVHHYFDMLTVLRQLGVAPTTGAPAPSPREVAQAKH